MAVAAKSQPRPETHSQLDTLAPWVTPIAAAILVIVLAFMGPNLNRSNLRILTFVIMWVAMTSSWNLIGGYTGYTDFGHSVFVGVGGYVVGILMARLGILLGIESIAEQKEALWSLWQALPIAFVGGAIFAFLVGYPTLRLKGPYFSIAMLGLLVAGREIARNNPFDWTNGGKGISFYAPFSNPLDIYYVMLGIASTIFFVSLWMYRVQIGKMLKSIRDDEVGSDTRGINTTAIKIGIFMLAGGFTAMVGGTKAYWDGYIDPNTIFPERYHIEIIMMALLGGIGRPWGPVIGAVTFYYGSTLIWANTGQQSLLITGLAIIAIMLLMPGGLLSLIDPEDRGLAWVIRRWILGERDQVFADDEDFEFQSLPAGREGLTTEAQSKALQRAAAAKNPVVLEGANVVKDFGGLRAVNKVNFKIHQGEIVGLLGPNGSGKTTLFNCISGTLPTTEGTVKVAGQVVTGLPPWRINRAGLSRTFQRIRVYGKQTVYDNLLLARKWKGVPPQMWLLVAPAEIHEKANDLIEFLKINHVRNNLAHNLSGGQQRLLEIGMTLMSDPVVVLLDEATSGVNPALVEEIKESIRRLNQERGITFFLVEHNMTFAMELCSRLYVLDYGTLIAEGEPEDIQGNDKVIEAYFGRDE